MKGIIVYKGKYGATRQYAAWLRYELKLHLVQADHCKPCQIESSDPIIIGTSIYAGKMQVSQWLKKNVHLLKNKKVFLFVVCGTPAREKEKLQTYLETSVPAELLHQCQAYFLPGRLVYKRLAFWDKLVLHMGAMLTRDPIAKKRMLMDFDGVKRECLDEILSEIYKLKPAAEPALL